MTGRNRQLFFSVERVISTFRRIKKTDSKYLFKRLRMIKNTELIKTTEKWIRFNWFPQLLVIIVGLFVTLSSIYVIYRGLIIYQQYFPLINASSEMRLNATTSYLWFEEMLGGDKTKDLNDILKNLDRADWYAKAMAEGGENFYVKLLPLKDAKLHDAIIDLKKQLIRQRDLLENRLKEVDASGPGSDIDKIYHSTLERFIFDSKIFEIRVKDLIYKNYQVFEFISIGVVIFGAILFLTVSFFLYRYEKLRQKNYKEIIDIHDALIKKEKMATLGMMTAGIAHEVNSPNSYISMNIDILKDYLKEIWPIIDKHAENKPDYNVLNMPFDKFKLELFNTIQNIENGSDRINRTVSTLKNFSKKKDQTSNTWFKISHTIDSVIEICGSKLNYLVDSFEVNIAKDFPEKICSDPEILQIVIINLLINSAEAVDKPNSWIKLNFSTSTINGKKKFIIEVKDNGSGISDIDIQRIFKPFYSTKSSNKNIGLGLYLCQLLLDQIGALIEVESKVNLGSEFRIIFDAS